MKAPEKIWINPATDLSKLSGHIDKNSVEYTRTDAFIEKACSWLKENAARFSTESTMEVEYFVEVFKKEIRGYVYGLRK